MAAKITITASDVWGYFQSCKGELRSRMYQIAGNAEYGIAIFITEDSGFPSIIVTADDVKVCEETTVNECDCTKTVSRIYDDYLTDKVLAVLGGVREDDDEPTELEIDDMIAERENDLDCAVYEFLMAVLENAYIDRNGSGLDDIVDDLKEHFLEYMVRKHGLPIRRPMYLEYDDGTEELEEYPYEHMEFDDEDNPIYKS